MLYLSEIHKVFFPEQANLELEAGRAGLFTGKFQVKNRAVVNEHRNNSNFAWILHKANDLGLLTSLNAQVNFIALSQHEHLAWVNQALDNVLVLANTSSKLSVLRSHPNWADLSLNLSVAHDLGLLTHEANFDLIANHEDLQGLFIIMSGVFRTHMHTPKAAPFIEENLQNTFIDIVSIISRQDVLLALRGIPDEALTNDVILNLLRIAGRDRANPESACLNMVSFLKHRQALHLSTAEAIQQPTQAVQIVKPAPKVRSSQPPLRLPSFFPSRPLVLVPELMISVHESASHSAVNLYRRYFGIFLNTSSAIRQITNWLDELSANPDLMRDWSADFAQNRHLWLNKVQVVKRSLNNLAGIAGQHTDQYSGIFLRTRCLNNLAGIAGQYTDPYSGISLRTLLVLVWTAFNSIFLNCDRAEAKRAFFEGLYEIQYGNDSFPTQMETPMCPKGAFVKLIEIGHGLHPDMHLIWADRTSAQMKLPVVVRDKAIEYLSRIPVSERSSQLQAIRAADNYYSVEPFWNHIKADVSRALKAEFPSLFNRGRSADYNPIYDLELFIEPGKDVGLSEDIIGAIENQQTSGFKVF